MRGRISRLPGPAAASAQPSATEAMPMARSRVAECVTQRGWAAARSAALDQDQRQAQRAGGVVQPSLIAA